ncbi:type VII toxin-antitoxin system MntA family adenylyltransferase antitoxin [Clostridium pasteurianum]|uniref:Putative nucleotidyltransferase n=1 Tax=Clostridium pasteurianum BC1 TaxID=86416 RepID=R4K687_CLOPA|nr:nucleotidyltransferase domain-containing protein [Clostridium pasteurianum]AGK98707.1 putative nucleotidyltransferase [Clostridium pasteurianum BC1]
MNLDKNTIENIKNFLLNNLEPYAIYLFGSSAKGIFREDSDIDIAFLNNKNISDYELFMLAQELADTVKKDVDLINLENASTVFKVQIIYNGEKIYCSDDTRVAYFEMYAFKDYATLNEEREVIIKSIKKGGSVYE